MDTVRHDPPPKQARHVTIGGRRFRLVVRPLRSFVRIDGGQVRPHGSDVDHDAGTLTIYGATEADRVRNAFFAGRDLAEDAARRKEVR